MVFNAQPSNVEWVFVEGRVLGERGQLVGVDVQAVIADANRVVRRVRTALGRQQGQHEQGNYLSGRVRRRGTSIGELTLSWKQGEDHAHNATSARGKPYRIAWMLVSLTSLPALAGSVEEEIKALLLHSGPGGRGLAAAGTLLCTLAAHLEQWSQRGENWCVRGRCVTLTSPATPAPLAGRPYQSPR